MEENSKNFKFISSAPAKVIFSGEHAVVYGSGAISCAIDLRTNILTNIKFKNHLVDNMELNFFSLKIPTNNNFTNENLKNPDIFLRYKTFFLNFNKFSNEVFNKINIIFIFDFLIDEFHQKIIEILFNKNLHEEFTEKNFDIDDYIRRFYDNLNNFNITNLIGK